MKLLLSALFGAVSILLAAPLTSAASQGRLELKVFPMDCLFDVIDDGYNQLIQGSPEVCNIVTPPQSLTPHNNADASGQIRLAEEAVSVPEVSLETPSFTDKIVTVFSKWSALFLASLMTTLLMIAFMQGINWSFGSGIDLIVRFIRSIVARF